MKGEREVTEHEELDGGVKGEGRGGNMVKDN